jgi:hypothetical protein
MSLNVQGIGFSFGGEDKGLGKLVSAISSGMSGLGGVVDRLISTFKSSHVEAQAFLSNFNTILNDSMNLTTGLEGQMVGLSKGARALGANFGYTGEALNKFTREAASMALGLNVGEQVTAKAIRGYMEMSQSLDVARALGISSAKELAKFTEAFGLDADLLRNSALRMRLEFGLSEEAISNVVGSIVSMGQQTGDVTGALGELPQVMEIMSAKAELMGKKLSELDKSALVGLATQTSAIAAGMFRLNQSSDQVRSTAMSVTGAFLEAEKGLHNLFAGTNEEFPKMIEEFSIVGMDATKAMELMKSGPAGFMSAMAQMVQNAKGSGGDVERAFDFMRARLEQVFPEASKELMNFFRTADDAALTAIATTKSATAELGKLAKETFRTGRTMAEQMELMEEAFIVRLRKGAKGEVRDFVKGTRKEFMVWADKINELSADDGILGALARKMSLIHHIGAKGLLPKALQPMSQVLGTLINQVGPLLVGFKLLGGSFTALLGPVGLVLGALGVLGYAALDTWMKMKPTKKGQKSVTDFFDLYKDRLTGLAVDFGEWVAAINWDAVIKKFNDFVDDVVGIFSSPKLGEFGKGFMEVFDTIPWTKLGTTLWDGIVRMYNSVPWDNLTEKIKATMKRTWEIVVQEWGKLGKIDLVSKFENLSGLEKVIWGAVAAFAAFKVAVIAANVVVAVFKGLAIAAKVAMIAWKVVTIVLNAVMAVFSGIMIVVNAIMAANPIVLIVLALVALGVAIAGVIIYWDEIKEVMGALWSDFTKWISDTLPGFTRFFTETIPNALKNFGTVIAEFFTVTLPQKFGEFTSWLTNFATVTIPEKIQWLIDAICTKVAAFTGILAGPFTFLFDKIKSIWGNSPSDVVASDMLKMEDNVKASTDAMAAMLTKTLFESVTTTMLKAFGTVFEKIQTGTDKFVENMVKKLQLLAMSIDTIFLDMWTKIVIEGVAAVEMMDSVAARLAGNFERLALARESLVEVGKEPVKPADVAALRAEVRKTATLEEAIHAPAWYLDPINGYRHDFFLKMDELIRAVNASRASAVPIPARTAVRGALKKAGEEAIGAAGGRALGR